MNKNCHSLIAALILIMCAVLPFSLSCAKKPAAFYVSPSGDDSNSGSLKKPFKTLTKARDTARLVPAGEPKKIILRDGRYYDVELALSPADSGLTIDAYPGEKPILYGGIPVTNWTKTGDFYTSPIEGIKEGTRDFRMLIIGDEVRPRARLPRTGHFTHLTRFDEKWITEWYSGRHKATEEENTTMKYKKGDIGPWLDLKNAEITVYGTWDVSHVKVKSIDDATRTIIFSIQCTYPPGNFGNGFHASTCATYGTYVVWNVREGIHEPGQWYLDRTAGNLVYWPFPGEDVTKLDFLVPTRNAIIRIEKGTKNVTIQGLTFSCSGAPLEVSGWGTPNFTGAIMADDVAGCRLSGLTIRNVEGQGIKIGGSDNIIENCDISQTGACGILLTKTKKIHVMGCHIHHAGSIYPTAVGVNETGEDNTVSHCEIHDIPYCGIGGGGDRSVYENNLLYRCMDYLYDGAAIYIYGKDEVIRGNVVHSQRDEGWAVASYYMDLGSERCLAEKNLAVNTGWTVLIHLTKNCTIRNNVFIDKGTMRIQYPKPEGMVFEKNIAFAKEIRFYPADADSFPMANNVIFSPEGKVFNEKRPREEPATLTPFKLRDGSISADPHFVDWEHGDFSFKPESPAIKLGIEPLDIRSAGFRGIDPSAF